MPPSCCALGRSHPFAVSAGAALVALLATGARAGEDAADGGPSAAGELIEVEGARPEASARAPGAATSVVDVARFGGEVRSVAELLATAPGVTVRSSGGPGQLTSLSLRGATPDQSLVLLDGIPLQGPGGGAVDLSTLPAALFGRMVVSRGALGAQLGAGALGGAVELLPRSAAPGNGAGAQASFGSFTTAGLAADAEHGFEGGSALVGVQLDGTRGDFSYARQLTPQIPSADYYDFTRGNADSRRASGLVRVDGQLAAGLRLDVIAQATAADRGLSGAWPDPTPRSRALDQGGLLGTRLGGAAGEGEWSIRAYGRVDRIELRGVRISGDCADGTPDCPRSDERSTTARTEAELRLPLGDRNRLRLLASGGEEWIAGAPTGPHRRGLFALSAADDLALPRGLALHPALRVDAAGSAAALSPALTATWTQGALQLRAGWGLSFRPASFSELYLDQGGVLPNPGLAPERAWSLDAGATLRAGAASLSANVFWSAYRDLIVYELFPPFRAKPYNVGTARIAGAELQVAVPLVLGFVGQLSYSYLDAIDRTPGFAGHRLPYRPPHRLFARLARQGDRLEGYAEAAWTASMPRNQFDSAFVPAQTVLNAGAGARVLGPLWLDVEVKNLLDDRSREDFFQYPLPGLSLAVIAHARI